LDVAAESYATGHYSEAILVYESILSGAVGENVVEAQVGRARSLYALGDRVSAESILATITIKPTHDEATARALLQLARWKEVAGDQVLADRLRERILDEAPRGGAAHASAEVLLHQRSSRSLIAILEPVQSHIQSWLESATLQWRLDPLRSFVVSRALAMFIGAVVVLAFTICIVQLIPVPAGQSIAMPDIKGSILCLLSSWIVQTAIVVLVTLSGFPASDPVSGMAVLGNASYLLGLALAVTLGLWRWGWMLLPSHQVFGTLDAKRLSRTVAIGGLLIASSALAINFGWQASWPSDQSAPVQHVSAADAGLSMVTILTYLLGAVGEEILYRAIVFRSLIPRVGIGMAAITSSLIFAGVHLISAPGFIQVFVFGVVACWLLLKTGSVVSATLLHWLWNLALLSLG